MPTLSPQDARLARARAIVASGKITRAGNTYYVPSLTSDAVYRVELDAGGELRCSCPDFERRKQACKHCIGAALAFSGSSLR